MQTAIAGYGLDLPSPGQVCVSVLRVSGDDGIAVWSRVCARAGVPTLAEEYSLAQLQALSEVLVTVPGPLAIVGRSLGVRLRSYLTLASLAKASAAPAPAAPTAPPTARSSR